LLPAVNPVHLLSQAPFFRGISPESRAALASICRTVETRKGGEIFREGARGDAFYLLVHGRVQLHKLAPGGAEVVIKVIQPGEAFAEVILFEESRYPVTAIALAPCLALRILRRDVHALLAREDFRNDFIAMLMRKQRYLAERIRQLTTSSVEERFFHFLREQYGEARVIPVGMNKKQFAAAIGTTPETLSRLIRRLRAAGALTWQGNTIRLLAAT
jgi:CRP/FNR family transcriptional regulator